MTGSYRPQSLKFERANIVNQNVSDSDSAASRAEGFPFPATLEEKTARLGLAASFLWKVSR